MTAPFPARRLNLSQQALSMQIRTLEAALAQDLFERPGRGLVLTKAGRRRRAVPDHAFRAALAINSGSDPQSLRGVGIGEGRVTAAAPRGCASGSRT